MNDDLQELERSLERATASTGPPESDMDPQTAALREAWAVWGRLLEAAETPQEPLLVRWTPPRSIKRRWLPVAAGLSAALVTIGAATVWIALAARPPADSLPSPETAASTGQPGALAAATQPQSAPTASEAPWDDTVDEELAHVGQKLIRAQQDWHARTDAFDLVWSRLERIHAEVETGQL
jgi:hypothetical protein